MNRRSESKRVAVIGSGSMAVSCLRHLLENGREIETSLVMTVHQDAVSRDPLYEFCTKHGLQYAKLHNLRSGESRRLIEDVAPSAIFSINNFALVPEAILAIPPLGCVNFHNGPLPRYAGVNVCSWAIFNGELEYGVTWHYMEPRLDAGHIIAQPVFQISGTETAATLIVKCIAAGVRVFPEVLKAVLEQRFPGLPQDLSARTYYSRTDQPFGGWLPFDRSNAELDRFVRALSFHPLAQSFYRPRLLDEPAVFAEGMELLNIPTTEPAGRILSADASGLVFQTREGALRIEHCCDSDGNRLDPVQAMGLFQSLVVSYEH